MTNQLNATEQNSAVVLFTLLYEGIPNFESVYKILQCDHLNESY